MNGRRVAAALAGALAVAPWTTVLAQVPDAPTEAAGLDTPDRTDVRQKEWRWTLGLGPALMPEYEGSDKYTLVPLPLVKAQKGPVHATLLGLHLTSNLIPDANWRLGPSLNVRRGYGNADEKSVRQLDVDREFELGVKGGYDIPLGSAGGGVRPRSTLALAAEFLVDVSDKSNGYILTPSVTYKTALSERWSLGAGANFSYASDGYMSYYFGVSNGDAAKTGLKGRSADADVKDFSLFGSVGYALTEAWRVSVIAQYKRMVGDAEDSPVVDDKGDANNAALGLVVSYTW